MTNIIPFPAPPPKPWPGGFFVSPFLGKFIIEYMPPGGGGIDWPWLEFPEEEAAQRSCRALNRILHLQWRPITPPNKGGAA